MAFPFSARLPRCPATALPSLAKALGAAQRDAARCSLQQHPPSQAGPPLPSLNSPSPPSSGPQLHPSCPDAGSVSPPFPIPPPALPCSAPSPHCSAIHHSQPRAPCGAGGGQGEQPSALLSKRSPRNARRLFWNRSLLSASSYFICSFSLFVFRERKKKLKKKKAFLPTFQ